MAISRPTSDKSCNKQSQPAASTTANQICYCDRSEFGLIPVQCERQIRSTQKNLPPQTHFTTEWFHCDLNARHTNDVIHGGYKQTKIHPNFNDHFR